MRQDIDVARAAARRAADVIRDAVGGTLGTRWKGEVDPVTEIDRAAEVAIGEVLAKQRPADSILGEEGGATGSSNRRWVVDPIDGTVNFVHGIPHFAVSIALWDTDAPVVGVVLDVMRDELFAASAGEGATVDGRPITVSETQELGESVCATGFPYDRRERAQELAAQVERVLRRSRAIRRMGSAALDLAWVAAGRYDAYWEVDLQPWDIAAGLLLLTEAGGIATRGDGGVVELERGGIVASNGMVHEALRTALAGDP